MCDYVIVGAGSAGCVLANRLTEDPTTRVLLLEAGGPDDKREVRIPAAFSKLFKTPVDWAYVTDEQPQLENRRLYWPRGKMLGGSSSLNAMIYSRANPADHDLWAASGNPGWAFADVLPYYKKAENQERGASAYHGVGGPLNVVDPRYVNPLTHAFVAAGTEIGLRRNDDFNGASQEGIGLFQVNQKDGRRHSAADAYLRPAMQRPNLTVHTRATATRLLFEGARAVGVEYARNGSREQARAEREVIVSGGTIGSPQLLLLSGIGPVDQLRALGIDLVADVPGVGENLQDHIFAGVAHACTRPVSLASAEAPRHILNYLLFHRGPLTSNVGEAGGFVSTRAGLPAPDLELIFGPVYYMEHGFANPKGHGFSIGAVLERPRSRGRLTLRSANPFDPPCIQPNYLADADDLAVLLAGVELARRVAATKALASFRGPEIWPGPKVRSREEITGFIRRIAETLYHPIGTCKMGPDALAVVDELLRVRGIDGLRVADASVIPTHFTGHANAPTIMLAEKAADLIRGLRTEC